MDYLYIFRNLYKNSQHLDLRKLFRDSTFTVYYKYTHHYKETLIAYEKTHYIEKTIIEIF